MEGEPAPVPKSYLEWMLGALGPTYGLLLPLTGVLCFILVLIVVIRGRGPMATAALILIVHVPLLVGVFAALQGAIASYSVIAMSDSAPQASQVAAGISTSLFAPLVGMLMMIPGYATAALGALVRCVLAKGDVRESL